MQRLRPYAVGFALLAVIVTGVGATQWNAQRTDHPRDAERRTSAAQEHARDEAHNEQKAAEVRLYLTGAANNADEAWGAASFGHGLELLAYYYVPPAPPAPRVSVSRGTSTVGGACGGATNGADRYIARESGGNPNARNPSGAWGCYQIMPGTWSSSCSDLGQHGSASTSAQAACASRLPQSAWSASGPTG